MNRKSKHVLAIVLTFLLLVGSDLAIGMFGHYSGTTGNVFTVEAFTEYISTLTFTQFAMILVVAIGIWFLIWRLVGI